MGTTILPSLSCLLLAAAPAAAQTGFTERVSVNFSLVQGNGPSGSGQGQAVAVSGDGRVVAFLSSATNLVSGDTNGFHDAFVRDLDLELTQRVSVGSGAIQVNADVTSVQISHDGRFVAFTTEASNLSQLDTNGLSDVYLRDRQSLTTTLVSRVPGGVGGNSSSWGSDISADGRYVSFTSLASNLVPGDTNGEGDVFVFDRVANSISRVSVNSSGGQGAAISYGGALSADGRYVVFLTRGNHIGFSFMTPFDDIVVHDRMTGSSTLAGPNALLGMHWDAHPEDPTISDDGRYVAFHSAASNVVASDTNGQSDVFVWDRQAAAPIPLTTIPGVLVGDGASLDARISADGLRVVFESLASNLVPGDTNGSGDIFVAGVLDGTRTRVNLSNSDAQSSGIVGHSDLSANGARVAFVSSAADLVPGDTNFMYDVFARLSGSLPPIVYCESDDNSLGCAPSISGSGVASASSGSGFEIRAEELVNHQAGLLLYSKSGPQQQPFGGQYLCVKPPLVRAGVQGTGGGGATPNCSGTFSFDFNAWVATGNDPALGIGSTVWGQVWSRDPLSASGTHLTQGITFVLGP